MCRPPGAVRHPRSAADPATNSLITALDDPTGGRPFASPVFPALIATAVSEIDVLHSRRDIV
ncbi:hypothetical protein BQ8482_340177 [Mesorhizobium delmotii]|uniref:Uncharacterized protein n=1 Tax=Mesorhizobium delmotii TaxID=1631247 RepID=A0A2P9AQ46_9HYPH|nr:hypothetical protein BQ8482_340177 [Mesorhizobium delmotii]